MTDVSCHAAEITWNKNNSNRELKYNEKALVKNKK